MTDTLAWFCYNVSFYYKLYYIIIWFFSIAILNKFTKFQPVVLNHWYWMSAIMALLYILYYNIIIIIIIYF